MASLLFCVADDALYHLVNFLFAPCNFIGQHPHPYGVSQAHLVRVQRLRQPLGAGFVLVAVLTEPPQLGAVAHMLPLPLLHLCPQALDLGFLCGDEVSDVSRRQRRQFDMVSHCCPPSPVPVVASQLRKARMNSAACGGTMALP